MGSEDASESDFVDGAIEKKAYRSRWVTNVQKLPWHPFNLGIHMDTHHLISAEAVKISKLGNILVRKGYDINDLSNLVGFPATLPGACQLKTQLHRGDHTYARPGEEPYHDHVSSQLQELRSDIEECYGKTNEKEMDVEIHELLDPIGKKILKKINKFTLPLTDIFMNFHEDSEIGCANCFDVRPAKSINVGCSKGRHHEKNQISDGVDLRYQDSDVSGNKKIITYQGAWTPKVKA